MKDSGVICIIWRKKILILYDSTQQKFNTMKSVLDMWVHPDSNIKTNSWNASYSVTPVTDFNSHKTVNHSAEFIEPNETNKQLVNNLWCDLKYGIEKTTITT